jgi:hypothetical protein
VDVLQKPNEVWYQNSQWTYIRYYRNEAYALTVKESNGKLIAEDFYKIGADSDLRKGVLITKK